MTFNVLLEDLLTDIGGCGKFQTILIVLIHCAKTISTWSMYHMTFTGQAPDFTCADNIDSETKTEAAYNFSSDGSSCSSSNSSDCTSFLYDGTIHTAVSEWDLVCDRKWIVATITTIQMAGVLVGCFTAGHLGDLIGRKPTYFLSLLILIAFNIVAYFSVSWEMYAAVRFMLGAGCGFFITINISEMSEFTNSAWRPRCLAIPSWSIAGVLFALVAWIFKDWKNLHLASAAVGVPFMLTWWFIPESFRWLFTKTRYDDAESVIDKVARMNGQQKPDISKIIDQAKLEEKEKQYYSAIDLFKTKDSVIKTLALLFIWASESYAYYGLTFGVKNLAGNLYLNMAILSLIEIPALFVGMYCMNRFGRKNSCIVFSVITGICGIANGTFQNIDFPAQATLANIFAYTSRAGVALSWLVAAVLTTESYPTVIRSTAYGVHNTAARVGGMIAPQVVFLNDHVPGLLFFLSGGLMFATSLLCCLFAETKGKVMEDLIHQEEKTGSKYLHDTIINPIHVEIEKNETGHEKSRL